MPAPDPDDDALWEAMADPTRRAILRRLARGPATAGEIGALFPLSQPAVSRHLKVLGEAGLIRRAVDAQRRPAMLEPAALDRLAGFVDGLREAMRRNFDRLDAVLAEMGDEEEPTGAAPDGPKASDPATHNPKANPEE